jgi:hypothetical protein
MYFEAPLPPDFSDLMEKWRGYHEHVLSKQEEE